MDQLMIQNVANRAQVLKLLKQDSISWWTCKYHSGCHTPLARQNVKPDTAYYALFFFSLKFNNTSVASNSIATALCRTTPASGNPSSTLEMPSTN